MLAARRRLTPAEVRHPDVAGSLLEVEDQPVPAQGDFPVPEISNPTFGRIVGATGNRIVVVAMRFNF